MELYKENEQYIDIVTFYALSLCGYNMHMHRHKSCEIMYVTKGECQIYIDQTECLLREHQVTFLLNAGTPHRLWIPKEHTVSLLNLFEFYLHRESTNIQMTELANIVLVLDSCVSGRICIS